MAPGLGLFCPAQRSRLASSLAGLRRGPAQSERTTWPELMNASLNQTKAENCIALQKPKTERALVFPARESMPWAKMLSSALFLRCF